MTDHKHRPHPARSEATQEEFLRLQKQVDHLLTKMRQSVERDWRDAQAQIATTVRLQTARGLAPQFLERRTPYADDAALSALIEQGLLSHAAFIQKPPAMLAFYRRLLLSLVEPPRTILEIGVKGGGSTAFWKTLFPAATVVGVDIKLRPWLTDPPEDDGVVYVQADQSDTAALDALAEAHGPFSLVIDDGSHVTDHQVITLRALLPHVHPGGLYVIEDIHTAVKPGSDRDYGADVWGDFTRAVFERLRRGTPPPDGPGADLARRLVRYIDDLIITSHVLALRVGARKRSAATTASNGDADRD